MKKITFAILGILLSSNIYAACNPIVPLAGGSGVCNNNANTLTLGGAVDITGAFTGIPASDSNVVHLSGDQTISGIKTFLSAIAASITGNADTVTNGVYTTGSYSNPSWLTALDATKITSGILPSARLSGTYNSAISGATNSLNITTTTGNADFYIPLVNSYLTSNNVPFANQNLFYHPSTGLLSSTNLNLSGLTASQLTATDSSKNLVSGNLSGDVSSSGLTTTLATVNSNVGSFGSASLVPIITVNGKGLITAASTAATVGSITGTANQVIASGATGAVTLSLPQSIATTSTPTFGGMTVNGGNSALSVGNAALTAANSAETFSGNLADGNYINLGTGGRDLGVYINGATFLTQNLDYDKTIPGFKYASNNGGTVILLGNTSGSNRGIGQLLYAASGTAGATASMSTALTWSSAGINVPLLSASSLVATDGSSNLTSNTSGISPTLAGGTITGTSNRSLTITSTTTGSSNMANLFVNRGDQANGNNLICHQTAGTSEFCEGGLNGGGSNWYLRDMTNTVNVLTVTQGATNTSNVTAAGKITAGNDITANSGDIISNTAGKTLKVKQGSNACAGTGATMVAGAVTVNTTCAATGDIILIDKTASSGTIGTGMPTITIVNGTSFTITSGSALETSTFSWFIMKAA